MIRRRYRFHKFLYLVSIFPFLRHQWLHNFFSGYIHSLPQASDPKAPPSIHSLSKSSGHLRYCLLQVLYCLLLPSLSFSTSISGSLVVCILMAASPISHCLWVNLIPSSDLAQAFQTMDSCKEMSLSWSNTSVVLCVRSRLLSQFPPDQCTHVWVWGLTQSQWLPAVLHQWSPQPPGICLQE